MEVIAETKFRRYLHFGSEDGVYVPGCRFHFKNYTPEKLTSLPLLVSMGKEKTVIDIIQQVHRDKTSPYPEALIFVLAQCCRNKESPILREGAYNLAETICSSAEYFFLFFKFAFEIKPKSGSGRACRRMVKNWYLKKGALKLAEIVVMKPRYRGWSHADILAIAHVKSKEPAKAAVLKYVVKGLDAAKEEFSKNDEAQEVLSYLTTVSEFRKIKDNHQAAARLIESYMLAIEHVNFAMLKDKEIWTALLRNMPLSVLLDHFQWLSKNGMFRNSNNWDFEFVKSVCDALSNPNTIADSGIHPSRVFIELCTYKNAARMKLDMATKLHMKPSKAPPALNSDLIKALEKVVRSSFKLVTPTGLAYAIGVDVNEVMQTIRCGHCRYVNAVQGGNLIIMSTLKAEKSVDILAFSTDSGRPVMKELEIAVTCTVEQCQEALHEVATGPIEVKNLFSWAIAKQKKIDVFIVLTTFVKQISTVVEELTKYNEAMGTTSTRVVLCNLSGIPKLQPTIEHSHVFSVSGFDDKVCKLIEAFSRGAF